MRTITLALLLLAPVPAMAMDTSLDRPVSREEAAKPAAKADAAAKGERPASAKPGDVAGVYVAECRDGLRYYHPTGERRGACSGHGGVAAFADGTTPKSKGGKGSYR